MKTVLIVEKNTHARNCLVSMVQQAPIPIQQIIACETTSDALSVSERNMVDVVFTDFNTGSVDDLNFIRQLTQYTNPPMVVIVSAQNNFNDAVEMLRLGVRDYLLKPINHTQITTLLFRFEEEITIRLQKIEAKHATAIHLARSMLQGDYPTETAIDAISRQYGHILCAEKYQVACLAPSYIFPPGHADIIDIGIVQQHRVLLLTDSSLQKPYLGLANAGFSRIQKGLCSMRNGFLQAHKARQYACLFDRNFYYGEPLITKYSDEVPCTQIKQIIHLVGRNMPKEACAYLQCMLKKAQNCKLHPDKYENALLRLLDGICANSSLPPLLTEKLQNYKNCWQMDSSQQYTKTLVLQLHEFSTLLKKEEEKDGKKRIQQALAYIKDNFTHEINMAVVSNHISMNYSQFSHEFKQYTGFKFQDYLRELRISEAKRLLSETEHAVKEIALACGFKNEKHFMKTFKQTVAVSPSEYRKNSRLGLRA